MNQILPPSSFVHIMANNNAKALPAHFSDVLNIRRGTDGIQPVESAGLVSAQQAAQRLRKQVSIGGNSQAKPHLGQPNGRLRGDGPVRVSNSAHSPTPSGNAVSENSARSSSSVSDNADFATKVRSGVSRFLEQLGMWLEGHGNSAEASRILGEAFQKGEGNSGSNALQIIQEMLGGSDNLPKFVVASDSDMQGANGAYSQVDGGVVFLNERLFAESADTGKLVQVIAEETGHHIDAKLGRNDAKGDEGRRFANLILGTNQNESNQEVASEELDHGTIKVEGVTYSVEFQSNRNDEAVALRRIQANLESEGNRARGAFKARNLAGLLRITGFRAELQDQYRQYVLDSLFGKTTLTKANIQEAVDTVNADNPRVITRESFASIPRRPSLPKPDDANGVEAQRNDQENRPPVFSDLNTNLRLNGASIGRTSTYGLGSITAVDPDGDDDKIRYRFVGNHSGFTMGGQHGALRFRGNADDFGPGPRTVTIRAIDEDGQHTDKTFTIELFNRDQAPSAADNQLPVRNSNRLSADEAITQHATLRDSTGKVYDFREKTLPLPAWQNGIPLQQTSLGGSIKIYAEDVDEANTVKEAFEYFYNNKPKFKRMVDELVRRHGSFHITIDDIRGSNGQTLNVEGRSNGIPGNAILINRPVVADDGKFPPIARMLYHDNDIGIIKNNIGHLIAHELLHNLGFTHFPTAYPARWQYTNLTNEHFDAIVDEIVEN